jgi:hypothetical protein
MLENNKQTADAVITWVDGSDPVLTKKREQFKAACIGDPDIKPSGILATRFDAKFELFYNIQLIRKNLKFIDNIYIVTDEQKPDWFDSYRNEDNRVFIVDHQDIFHGYEENLPTFNAYSIESMIFRLKPLKEHFIYFNDDFFITREMNFSDWFKGGMPFYRVKSSIPKWINKLLALVYPKIKIQNSGYLRFNHEPVILNKLGYKAVKNIVHAPYPVVKSRFQKFMGGLAIKNSSYKFRHKDNFRVFVVYANIELNYGAGSRSGDWGYVNFQRDSEQQFKTLKKLLEDTSIKMICIQSVDCAEPQIQVKVEKALRSCLD